MAYIKWDLNSSIQLCLHPNYLTFFNNPFEHLLATNNSIIQRYNAGVKTLFQSRLRALCPLSIN